MDFECINGNIFTIYDNFNIKFNNLSNNNVIKENEELMKLIFNTSFNNNEFNILNSNERVKSIINIILKHKLEINNSIFTFLCNNLYNYNNNEQIFRILLISYYIKQIKIDYSKDEFIYQFYDELSYISKIIYNVNICENSDIVKNELINLFYYLLNIIKKIKLSSKYKNKYECCIKSLLQYFEKYYDKFDINQIRIFIINNNCNELSESIGYSMCNIVQNNNNLEILYKIVTPLYESIEKQFNQSISIFLNSIISKQPKIGIIYYEYFLSLINIQKYETKKFALQNILSLCLNYPFINYSYYYIFLSELQNDSIKIQQYIINNIQLLINIIPEKNKNDYIINSIKTV